MQRPVVSLVVFCFCCLGLNLSSLARAQGDAEPLATASERNFETYTPRVVAVRIDEDDAPVIDGDLSDLAWLEASPINEFYQIEPVEGATPSQPTLAYVVYDRKNLYVGIYAYDSEPGLITRNQLQRIHAFATTTGWRIFIDSNGTFRDSYFFGMNANGAPRRRIDRECVNLPS